MPRGPEQAADDTISILVLKSVTFLPAFSGFSSETAENRLAKSRKAHPNGLARGQ
jgi:hypothetical protein